MANALSSEIVTQVRQVGYSRAGGGITRGDRVIPLPGGGITRAGWNFGQERGEFAGRGRGISGGWMTRWRWRFDFRGCRRVGHLDVAQPRPRAAWVIYASKSVSGTTAAWPPRSWARVIPGTAAPPFRARGTAGCAFSSGEQAPLGLDSAQCDGALAGNGGPPIRCAPFTLFRGKAGQSGQAVRPHKSGDRS